MARRVLLHDEDLGRVFGRPALAAERSATELALVGVPTLAAALAALPPDAFVDVELKEALVEATVAVAAAARGDPTANGDDAQTGRTARTIALYIPSATAWVGWTSMFVRPAASRPVRNSAKDSAPAMQPT